MSNATLTYRCGRNGCKVAEVIWEKGKPRAYVRESVALGKIHGDQIHTHQRALVTCHDVMESDDILTSICKCGRRQLALAQIRDDVQGGRTGKVVLTDTPT